MGNTQPKSQTWAEIMAILRGLIIGVWIIVLVGCVSHKRVSALVPGAPDGPFVLVHDASPWPCQTAVNLRDAWFKGSSDILCLQPMHPLMGKAQTIPAGTQLEPVQVVLANGIDSAACLLQFVAIDDGNKHFFVSSGHVKQLFGFDVQPKARWGCRESDPVIIFEPQDGEET